jgi:hypothetical protein
MMHQDEVKGGRLGSGMHLCACIGLPLWRLPALLVLICWVTRKCFVYIYFSQLSGEYLAMYEG